MKQLTALLFSLFFLQTMSFAQSQRLVLVEHFTQASCGPCASQNPLLRTTLLANSTKAIALKHQVSWPGTDPMYTHYPAGPSDRRTYYGITGVPNTVLGGIQGPGAPNTVVTTATINTRYAVASPFDLTVSFSVTGGVITATTDIACTQAVSGTLVLHVAVIEKHIGFGSAPGSNGEVDFHNVMKQMLPSTSGTALAGSWAVGNTQSISESWTLSNVYDNNELAVIVFIQDNVTKEVHQAGYASSTTPTANDDSGILDIPTAGNQCGTSHDAQVELMNYGANTLSSTTINYDVDGGTPATYNWTGSLASGSSTVVSLPNMTVAAGYHTFNSWTTLPNGVADTGPGNDSRSEPLSVGSETIDLVITTDCWGSETSWEVHDASGNTWSEGGGYGNVGGGTTENHSFCLVPGDCYDFIINDSYGDGMYGSQYGSCTVDGNYIITDQSANQLATIIAANSDFGNQEVNNFCVPSLQPLASDFVGVPTTVCEGSTVNFTDASTGNMTTWNWSFTGGTPATSSVQNPGPVVYAASGNYQVSLIVGDGSTTDTKTVASYITVLSAPTAGTSAVDATCGQTNGSTTATPSGGQAPYTYAWDDQLAQTTATATGLSVGVYNCTVTDANGCSVTVAATVGNPGAPIVTGAGVDATCAQNDGSAAVTITGGSAPFIYVWVPNVSTSASATGLAAGVYNVTVTDNNGCASSVSITIVAPSVPSVSGTATDEVCAGDCDGSLNATATGGTAPYTYNWDGGIGAGQTQSSVCPGTYVVTITDASGCTSTSSVTIAAGAAAPVASFTASATNVDVGIAVNFTNTSTGGTTYNWDFGDGNSSANQSPSHSYAAVGTYTVVLTVTNAAGCAATFSEVIVVSEIDGVSEMSSADLVQLFPNPSHGELQLSWGALKVRYVEVVNILGAQVYVSAGVNGSNSHVMDLSAQPNGVYFVNVHTDEETIAKRVVIAK
jgi:PKD repeat protein